MIKLKRGISLFVCAAMLLGSLAGCGDKDKNKDDSHVINYEGKPNVTASPETKWIDSDIYGMIDNSLVISEKDDFYTAVNKDWILAQERPTNEKDDITLLMEGNDIVKERLISIVSGEKDPDAFDGSQVDIADDEIAHNLELVVQFVGTAADWDARNKASVEPIKNNIEDIMSLSSIDEMTEYMSDLENRNVSLECLIGFETYAGAIDAETYRCIVSPDSRYVLNTPTAYTNTSFSDCQNVHLTDEIVCDVLTKLGHSEKEAKQIIKDCYRFEGMLIDHSNLKIDHNPETYDKNHTLDELIQISGNYPFEKVYRAYGFSDNDFIRISDTGYLKFLNTIYNNSNLNLLKSYFVVHAINNSILLLDRNYYDKVIDSIEKYDKDTKSNSGDGDGDVKEAKIKDEWDLILNKYAMPYIGGPLNIVYISRYCSEEQKNELKEIVTEVIANYHKIIDSEEWLSLSAKKATHEKLDYITARVLYPDKLDSFKELEFQESDNLVSMVHKINLFKLKNEAAKVNKPVEKDLWNLGDMPTTTINAYYRPDENSINIFAGIVAGKNVFNVENKEEVNLSRIGTIIGHEISHAFDLNGSEYDKNGYKKTWWDTDDRTTFGLRITNMMNYYSGIQPYPGAKNLIGPLYVGEAIADMGGVSVILMVAKDREDFDYDLFFRSYAELWRTSRSLGYEEAYVQDVHPLSYLRTNVTLSQFDEFLETYDIKEGDGMYCAPENRIKVW